MKRVRAGSTMGTFQSSMGSARMNTFTVRVPAGGFGTTSSVAPWLPLCWDPSLLVRTFHPSWGQLVEGENPALVLVSLGLLVVLVCRLLFVLVSPGYRLANHWWVEPFSPAVLPCETALARFLYLLPISGILGRKGSVWCT